MTDPKKEFRAQAENKPFDVARDLVEAWLREDCQEKPHLAKGLAGSYRITSRIAEALEEAYRKSEERTRKLRNVTEGQLIDMANESCDWNTDMFLNGDTREYIYKAGFFHGFRKAMQGSYEK